MIAMRGRHQLEGFATIAGTKGAGVQHIDHVRRRGVGKYVAVVPGALPEAMVVIDPYPREAGIIGAE